MNFSNGRSLQALAGEGDVIWIGSSCGLVKLNQSTGEKYFHNSASGLPATIVTALAIDEESNIWIGTERGGLAKFDRSGWTLFNTENSLLPSNEIRALVFDTHQNLWIGTALGLARYDGNTWTSYNSDNSGLPSNSILSLGKDKSGRIWVGTSGGLAQFDGYTWQIYSPSNSELPFEKIRVIITDNDGNLWMGSEERGGGLVKFDGKNWEVYNSDNSGLYCDEVYSLAIDEPGNIWVGTAEGLVKFDGLTWMSVISENSEIPCGRILSILVDAYGNKWIGHGEVGLIKYDDNQWTIYNTSTVPPQFMNGGINTIAVDQQGNGWLGTPSCGLMKYNGKTWQSFNPSNSPLPSGGIGTITIDEDHIIWIGDQDRLARYDGVHWQVYDTSFKGHITSVVIDHRRIAWVGTERCGLIRFESLTGEIIATYDESNSELPANCITSLALDENNRLWIGTDPDSHHSSGTGGLAMFDGVNWTIFDSSNSPLPENRVLSLAFDTEDHLWILTSSNLMKFDGSQWIVYKCSDCEMFSYPGLYTLTIDKDNIKWIGTTNNGLIKFDNRQWNLYTTFNSGLPENRCRSIAADAYGNIWIGTFSCGFAIFRETGIVGSFDAYDEKTYSIEEIEPNSFISHQNVPNPFNAFTAIRFELSSAVFVKIEVFNILGRKMNTLLEEEKPPGIYTVTFDATHLPSGLYSYRILAGPYSETKKMILIR